MKYKLILLGIAVVMVWPGKTYGKIKYLISDK